MVGLVAHGGYSFGRLMPEATAIVGPRRKLVSKCTELRNLILLLPNRVRRLRPCQLWSTSDIILVYGMVHNGIMA